MKSYVRARLKTDSGMNATQSNFKNKYNSDDK